VRIWGLLVLGLVWKLICWVFDFQIEADRAVIITELSEEETMHKLVLIGHLGRDPEMRYTPEGQPVTSFSVASTRKYTMSSGEQREETEWFNCSAWGKLAEITNQYLTKGKQVYIEGRLRARTYQAQSGETRVSLDISVNEVQFLGGQSAGQQAGDAQVGGDQGAGEHDGGGGEVEAAAAAAGHVVDSPAGEQPVGAGVDDDLPF